VLLGGAAVGVVAWQVRSVPTHYAEHLALLEAMTTTERAEVADKALSKFDAVVALASGGRFGTATTLEAGVDLGQATDTGEGSPAPTAGPSLAARRQRLSEANSHDRGIDTDTVYTVEMSPDELNILLSEQLAAFLGRTAQRLPAGVGTPMIASEGANRFVTTFTVSAEGVDQTISAYFDLIFASDGEARVEVTRYDAGRMPVPAGRIGDALAEHVGEEEVQRVGRFLADLKDYRFNPVLESSGGHRLRVLDFRTVDAGFAFDVRVIDGGAPPLMAKVGE
jgi:hypothetical protein